jgi:hypothetical protein
MKVRLELSMVRAMDCRVKAFRRSLPRKMDEKQLILDKIQELLEAKKSQDEAVKQIQRVLTKLVKKLNQLSRSATVQIDLEQPGYFERIVDFLMSKDNEPQSAAAIMRATRIRRGSLSQIFYRSHKNSFISFKVPGYSRKKLWALSEETALAWSGSPKRSSQEAAKRSSQEAAHARSGDTDLFGQVIGDLTGVDAAECCFRILRDHKNKPMSVITMTREALERGYRARTKGHPDEVLFNTTKSFWARLGRDQRFRKVRAFVYELNKWPQ